MDSRRVLLEAWLPAVLSQTYQLQGWGEPGEGRLEPASADASFRRYFRWQDGQRSLVVMDAPPVQEDSRPFVQVAGLLAEAGVRTPTIYASDLDQGFLLLEDMGARTYLQTIEAGVDEAELERLYDAAVDTLVRWQLSSRPGVLPEYDEAVLRRELQLFPDWYVTREKGRELSAGEQAEWEALCNLLLDSILAENRVFVHRDYMPRNLMTAGVAVPDACDTFMDQSRLMGVQRHLKVLGIFARICHRDGKPHYLADAPRFISYLHEACERDARLAPLRRLLESLEMRP